MSLGDQGLGGDGGPPLPSLAALQAGLGPQNPNLLFAGPVSGPAALAGFRALVDADIPSGITASKVAGALTNATLAYGSLSSVPTSFPPSLHASSHGNGGSDQLAILASQNANLIFAGPATGGPAAPGYRSLATADLPASIQSLVASQNVNLIYAGPSSGAAAAATFRALGVADLPASVKGTLSPTDFNFKVWSLPPSTATTSVALTSGTAVVTRVKVADAFTCTSLAFMLSVAVAGQIGGQNQLAIYTSAGALLWASSYFATAGLGSATSILNGASLTQQSTSGSGSGFTATATVSGGNLTAIVPTAAGSGYAEGDTVTLTDGSGHTVVITMHVPSPSNYQLLDPQLAGSVGQKTLTVNSISIPAGYIYVVQLQNATTCASIRANANTSTYIYNFGLSVATSQCATLAAGKTSLPTSITPSTDFTQSGIWPCYGLA